MDTIINKKRTIQMNTVIGRKKEIREKIASLISLLTILALTSVIIITSYLIFDLVGKIRESSSHTIVYQSAIVEEEPETLTVTL